MAAKLRSSWVLALNEPCTDGKEGGDMATKRDERLAAMIEEMEVLAKRVRTTIRRVARDSGFAKELERAAASLRKRLAVLMAALEKYIHELRVDLVAARPAKRPTAKRRARAA
jgi:hypothetical protein